MSNKDQPLTHEIITGLSETDSRELFESLGLRFYKTDLFRPRFAFDVDIQARTVNTWRNRDNTRPPVWAILLLDAWLKISEMTRSQEQIGEAYDIVRKWNQDR